MQLGGVQEAVRVAPPRLLRAVAPLLPELLVVVVKAATSGFVVLQVRGGLASAVLLAMPHNVSTAMAVIGTLPPVFIVIEFPPWPWPPSSR